MSDNLDVSIVRTGIRVPVHSLVVRAWRRRTRSGGCVVWFKEVCAEEEVVAAAAGQCGRRKPASIVLGRVENLGVG
jgi:hypothetical protein